MGTLLRSCAKVSAAIELSLKEVSRVSHGMGVIDGVNVPPVERRFCGFGVPIHVLIHFISLNGVFLYATFKF